MSDAPDFDKLRDEFAKLKNYGQELQSKGIDIVRLAEAGTSNVATYSSLFAIALPLAKSDKALQQKLDLLAESGRYTSDAVSKTNDDLGKVTPQLAAVGMTTLTGVTFSNFAALDIISYASKVAQGEQKRALDGLARKSLSRPFKNEDLDVLLRRFEDDLPSRRAGAWDAFHSASADALAQASHTMRDILRRVIAREATNELVERCSWYIELKKKKPDVSDRIRYLLFAESKRGMETDELRLALNAVSEYTDDNEALVKTAHGSLRFDQGQIKASLEKIEELLFLVLKKLEERGRL